MSVRTVIVDDESLARRGLRLRLEKFPRIQVVAECANGRQALAAVSEHQPDLLFLDIQMPGMDGFEVVRRLQADAMPLVVFVTAFDQFALDAFEVHAIDYVLKPVDEDRLGEAVDRVTRQLQQRQEQSDKERLIEFIVGLTGEPASKVEQLVREGGDDDLPGAGQKLSIKDGSTIHLVPFAEIDWIDAAGDYMCVHVAGDTHVMRATMKELEDQLDPRRFARVHRSTLVNVHRVEKVAPLENGKYRLTLRGGHAVTMSRSYRDQLDRFR